MEPPPITQIKSKNNEKLDKDFVTIKFCRYPTSKKLNPYEFKIALFDNREPDEFFLFIRNFNMTLEASGTLKYGENIQYLHILVSAEALSQFDTLSAEVGRDTPENLTSIILGLGTYFFLLM